MSQNSLKVSSKSGSKVLNKKYKPLEKEIRKNAEDQLNGVLEECKMCLTLSKVITEKGLKQAVKQLEKTFKTIKKDTEKEISEALKAIQLQVKAGNLASEEEMREQIEKSLNEIILKQTLKGIMLAKNDVTELLMQIIPPEGVDVIRNQLEEQFLTKLKNKFL